MGGAEDEGPPNGVVRGLPWAGLAGRGSPGNRVNETKRVN